MTTILDTNADHAARRKVLALCFELLRTSPDPTATKKEDDGRTLVRGFPVGGFFDQEFEFTLAGLFVSARLAGEVASMERRERDKKQCRMK